MKTKIRVSDYFDVPVSAVIGMCERTGGSLDLLIVDEAYSYEIERVPIGTVKPFPTVEIRETSSFPVREARPIKNLSPKLVVLGVQNSKVAYISSDDKTYRELYIANGEWRSIFVH